MLKIGIRRNLIYPLMLIIFNVLRKINVVIINNKYELSYSLSFILLMFMGEFIAGLAIYLYQISFFKRKRRNTFMGIKLIQGPLDISHPDNNFKIYFLLFIASYFDFIEFLLSTAIIPEYKYLSSTLEIRLSGLLTLSSALFFIYLLKFSIFKHQKLSLSIIFICLIIIIISEYFFQRFNEERKRVYYIKGLSLIFSVHFFNSLLDSIEKYLLEYDFINPFKALMMEGIFGTILTCIYSLTDDPLKKIKDIYNENKDKNFGLLIFLLVLYLLLCGGRNAYRVATNKIYSPMTKSLTDYIFNPFLIIYYFFFEEDFNGGERQNQNIFYFILNLILSFIIVFFSCIYNELFILFCCDLELETHDQISSRASSKENIEMEIDKLLNSNEEDDKNSDDS